MNMKNLTQEQANRLVWYNFGIKAKDILALTSAVNVENFDVWSFVDIQSKAKEAIETLDKDLKEYVRRFPD